MKRLAGLLLCLAAMGLSLRGAYADLNECEISMNEWYVVAIDATRNIQDRRDALDQIEQMGFTFLRNKECRTHGETSLDTAYSNFTEAIEKLSERAESIASNDRKDVKTPEIDPGESKAPEIDPGKREMMIYLIHKLYDLAFYYPSSGARFQRADFIHRVNLFVNEYAVNCRGRCLDRRDPAVLVNIAARLRLMSRMLNDSPSATQDERTDIAFELNYVQTVLNKAASGNEFFIPDRDDPTGMARIADGAVDVALDRHRSLASRYDAISELKSLCYEPWFPARRWLAENDYYTWANSPLNGFETLISQLKSRTDDRYKTKVLLRALEALMDIASQVRGDGEWWMDRRKNELAPRALIIVARQLGMVEEGRHDLYRKPLAMVYETVSVRLKAIADAEARHDGDEGIVKAAGNGALVVSNTEYILKGLEGCYALTLTNGGDDELERHSFCGKQARREYDRAQPSRHDDDSGPGLGPD